MSVLSPSVDTITIKLRNVMIDGDRRSQFRYVSHTIRTMNNLVQKSRWNFTFHNYPLVTNYKTYFSNNEFQIKRCIWGYETAPQTGTRHLQGYCEFNRSLRLVNVKRILPDAHWEGSNGNALSNFRYSTKSGEYDAIGDWSKEANGDHKKASVGMILNALMIPAAVAQVKCTQEFAERHTYYEKTSKMLKDLKYKIQLYHKHNQDLLYTWQFDILTSIFNQNSRQILWVCDETGNIGKTFLSTYLDIIYNFQQLNGTINTRDLGYMIDEDVAGFVVDVPRDGIENFDYVALECIKNGNIISGKYGGRTIKFPPKPVVVFSNNYPNRQKLSADRWVIKVINAADVRTEDIPTNDPKITFPPSPELQFPDLSEEFDLREYISNLQHNNEITRAAPTTVAPTTASPATAIITTVATTAPTTAITTTVATTTPTTTTINTSQTAGPSVHTRDKLPECHIHPDQSKI